MEKVFKAKGWTTWEIVFVIVLVILGILLLWYTTNYFFIISLLFPLFIGYNQYFSTYVVKENGDLWLKGMWGNPGHKGVGVYRVLYYPERKRWYNRNRRMVVFYKSGIRQGSFPLNPAEPEELMAALKERNPDLKIECFSMPVNK